MPELRGWVRKPHRARVRRSECHSPMLMPRFVRFPQAISKLGVETVASNVQTRSADVRVTRQALRQAMQQREHDDPAEESLPISVEQPLHVIDIDAQDQEDPQCCTTYVRDIYTHLREVEQEHRVMVQYMNCQQDINPAMRGILIDWLVEVAEEYRLVPETLYLAVNYIDRFLQQVPIHRGKLQLVGITCMLIAA